MPFDATPITENFTRTQLEDLSRRLRDRSTWPPGFRWDFSECQTCAMALLLGDNMPRTELVGAAVARHLNIDREDVLEMFGTEVALRNFGSASERCMAAVTPEMVAEGIDAWLELEPL